MIKEISRDKIKQCNRCGAEVVWLESKNGKFYLVNFNGGESVETTDFHSYACKPQAKPETEKPETETITRERADAALEAIKFLAARCNYATTLDGQGFSGLDTEIGHSLARCSRFTEKQATLALKITRKYRKTQLPAEIVQRMGV